MTGHTAPGKPVIHLPGPDYPDGPIQPPGVPPQPQGNPMSDKRWTVGTLDDDDEELLIWPADTPIYVQISNEADQSMVGNAESHAAYDALVADVQTAARVRALAARLGGPLNWNQRYTGAEVAAMLREAGE